MSAKLNIAFQVVRFVLVIILAIIFLISTIYFIRAIDAIGDDVDEAKETHWGHEVEDSPLFEESNNSFEYDDRESTKERNRASPHGRLILGDEKYHFGVTKSRDKQHHIISLIVWVVLTLFAAILSLAGIIGALCLNPCMVLFSACMVAVHAVFSHVLPHFHIQLPRMTSNWFLLALEVPAILLAIAFIILFRAREKAYANESRRRNILY